jgi:hypothetical protein
MRLATVDDILAGVEAATGVPRGELIGPGRRRADAMLAREAAIWLLRRVRGMEKSQVCAALDAPFRTVDACWRRLVAETDARGARRIALAAARWLHDHRGVDAIPNRPAVDDVVRVVAAHAQDTPMGVMRRTRTGEPWSVGRKAVCLCLLDVCGMKRHAVARALGVARSSVQEFCERVSGNPSATDERAMRIARAASEALRAQGAWKIKEAA